MTSEDPNDSIDAAEAESPASASAPMDDRPRSAQPDDAHAAPSGGNEDAGEVNGSATQIDTPQAAGGAEELRKPSSSPTPRPQAAKPAQLLCGVCEKQAFKYKCPRCYLPYCSVACNKSHRESHPPDPEPQPPKNAEAKYPSSLPKKPETPNSAGAASRADRNPFHALEDSEQLRFLFRKYPDLPNQLLEIHAATQPPSNDSNGNGADPSRRLPASFMRGIRKKGGGPTWNHDVGIKNGKAALRKARKASGEAGEAIREYAELILHVMNKGDDAKRANAYVQRQVAQEDTKLIEKLLAEEQQQKR